MNYCLECNKEIPDFYFAGNHKAKRPLSFCSRKCQTIHSSRNYYRKNCRNDKYKKWKSEYDKIYREKNHERKIKHDKEYYWKNRERSLLQSSKYQRKHLKEHSLRCRIWRKKHFDKVRETACLRLHFGKSKLPLQIKKDFALVHLGSRLIRRGNTTKVFLSKIPEIIIKIKKGVTYEAYK